MKLWMNCKLQEMLGFIKWGFDSCYLILLFPNMGPVCHCSLVISQCCLCYCSDVHMRDSGSAQCQWIPWKLLHASVCMCVNLHAFWARPTGSNLERADRICALWLHWTSNVQPPRGQEVSAVCHICWACRDRPHCLHCCFPPAQVVLTLSSPQ